MNNAIKPVWVILAIFVGVAIFAGLMKWMAPGEIIPWRSDYTAATTEALAAKKPIFIDFTATWCGPCQSLKTTTWADKNVRQALSGYVPVQVDVDKNRGLAEQFHINAIPAFFVVDPASGRLLKSSVGALDSQQFLAWLNSNGE